MTDTLKQEIARAIRPLVNEKDMDGAMQKAWLADTERLATAALSVVQPRIEAASLADEVRAIAEDSDYSNEVVGIAVRNWFHRAAIAALTHKETKA